MRQQRSHRSLRESTWLAVAGIVLGVGAALFLTRLVKSMLYAIQPYDPTTMSAGILVFAGGRVSGKLDSGTAGGRGAAYRGVAPRIKTEIGRGATNLPPPRRLRSARYKAPLPPHAGL